MNIQDTVRSISIDVSLLHGMSGHYLAQMEIDRPLAFQSFKMLIDADESIVPASLDAAADAVIFSQLAVTLIDDEEFEDALECRHELNEPVLVDMRLALFFEGIAVAKETIAHDSHAMARTQRRVDIARQLFM